ncbi:MAG: NAD-dependent protein deacylase [Clostridia bacterium]|nr:NAD-dependent protein deacylase [Clostridia bacterium]MBP3650410.1 NAD-dependent protein deacylase [Clostridia bacterium]
MHSQAIHQLAEWIRQAGETVFFGGAGVSTASGIPDFRSAHGIYAGPHGKTYEEMLSHDCMLLYPDAFWDFYRNVMLYPQAKPNGAHQALASMEAAGKLTSVVTQNIDGLHQAAGSNRVQELHGSVHRNYCMGCGQAFTLAEILPMETVPHCPHCGGVIRPDVVLYGEPLDDDVTQTALSAIRSCDLLIVGGTSLVVYPAAGMIQYRRARCNLVLINRDETAYDRQAELVIHEDIGTVLAQAWKLAQE